MIRVDLNNDRFLRREAVAFAVERNAALSKIARVLFKNRYFALVEAQRQGWKGTLRRIGKIQHFHVVEEGVEQAQDVDGLGIEGVAFVRKSHMVDSWRHLIETQVVLAEFEMRFPVVGLHGNRIFIELTTLAVPARDHRGITQNRPRVAVGRIFGKRCVHKTLVRLKGHERERGFVCLQFHLWQPVLLGNRLCLAKKRACLVEAVLLQGSP